MSERYRQEIELCDLQQTTLCLLIYREIGFGCYYLTASLRTQKIADTEPPNRESHIAKATGDSVFRNHTCRLYWSDFVDKQSNVIRLREVFFGCVQFMADINL